MSIGFVLLVLGIVGVIGAGVATVVLALVVELLQARRGGVRGPWVLLFAGFPFAALVYTGLLFGLYGAWCVGVRHVDPGIGDGWELPLPNGYSFQAIDTPEHSFIQGPDGEMIWVERVGASGPLLAADQAPSQFVLIDTRTRRQWTASSEAELRSRVSGVGFRWPGLSDPESFYYARRWTFLDALFGVVLFGLPVAGFCGLAYGFIRDLRNREVRNPPGAAIVEIRPVPDCLY